MLADLQPNPENPRIIKDEAFANLKKKLKKRPQFLRLKPIVYNEKMIIMAGNRRHAALLDLGHKEIPEEWTRRQEDFSREEWDDFVLWDNQHEGEWDYDMLSNLYTPEQLQESGIFIPDFEANTGDDIPGEEKTAKASQKKEARAKLQERFIVPPFSILNTSQGYWQDRRRIWLDLGIRSEVSREDNLLSMSVAASNPDYYREQEGSKKGKQAADTRSGTSIFDPVLCEIAYKWFCPPAGSVLDPFAGGSVRGLVASLCGLKYFGIDIREEQIEANLKNAREVLKKKDIKPIWIEGDARNIDQVVLETLGPKREGFDLLFSCPPYHDLEKYSQDPNDLSNLSYSEFRESMRRIIAESLAHLKQDRFAVFVVGEIRDKKGIYKNFVSDTISAFSDAGASYYNDIILYNTIAGAAIRADKIFGSLRKIVKVHQNVLVFFKGDPRSIKKNFPKIELDDLIPEESAQSNRAELALD